MPETSVFFYRDRDGRVPVLDWLDELYRRDRKAHDKCRQRIELLAESGHDLRRRHADTLRDGIRERRIRRGHVNYRILYFFHGRNVTVLGHALTKEQEVPERDIELAIRRKKAFERDPEAHTYRK